jgi:hypothetical protein
MQLMQRLRTLVIYINYRSKLSLAVILEMEIIRKQTLNDQLNRRDFERHRREKDRPD